jgi:PAS domain S-box-containing protein
MKKLPFNSDAEELQFLRKVMDSIPVMININQVDDLADNSTNFSLWQNRQVHDFTGYSGEEISAMGFSYFLESMHPEDLGMIAEAMNKFQKNPGPVYGGVVRIRPKNGDYHWFIGNTAVLEMKNGKPWRVIVTVQNLEEMDDTRAQILQLIKENLQLKNQLRFQSLSSREKQIIKLITTGLTDREIAKELSISPATVKTHRHNIIQKLKLKNKAAIAQFATENGLD